MEGVRASLGEVGVHNHLITREGPGGAETREPSCWGSILPGRCKMMAGGGRGGSMERDRSCFDERAWSQLVQENRN
jgi:hypothetical protein